MNREQEAEQFLSSQENRGKLLLLFAGDMPMEDIFKACGFSRASGPPLAAFLKQELGEKAYRERCLRVIKAGMQGKQKPIVMRICGECRSFLPGPGRVGGVRYGTCKKTGETVHRCMDCRMEEVRKHDDECC